MGLCVVHPMGEACGRERILLETCVACPGCVGFVALPMLASRRLSDEGGYESVAGAGPDKDGTGPRGDCCSVPVVRRRALV